MCVTVITVLMSSCMTTYQTPNKSTKQYVTEISSYGNYDIKGKTYYIESGNDMVSSDDIEFKEYASYLDKDLKLQGAINTKDKDNADLCILLNYFMTDESYTESIPVPEFGRTTLASTTTKGNTTTYNYNYGTTGYHYVQRNVSNYTTIVNIYCYDNKSRDSKPIMLWKTNFKMGYSSDNMRKVIQYILYMGSRKEKGIFGKSTGTDISVWVAFENEYMFQCWNQGILLKNNVINDPNTINSGNYCDIADRIDYVERQDNQTIICIFINGDLNNYNNIIKRLSNLYLCHNGIESPISNVINKDIFYLSNLFFADWLLYFPTNTENAKTIELREYTNSKHTKYITWDIIDLNE